MKFRDSKEKVKLQDKDTNQTTEKSLFSGDEKVLLNDLSSCVKLGSFLIFNLIIASFTNCCYLKCSVCNKFFHKMFFSVYFTLNMRLLGLAASILV